MILREFKVFYVGLICKAFENTPKLFLIKSIVIHSYQMLSLSYPAGFY